MRSMYRGVPMALVAVLALSGVTAASALASSEWLAKREGVTNRITSPVEVTATTNLAVDDTGWYGGTKVSCEGAMTATIEPGGVGKISRYTVSHCELHMKCGELGAVEAANLPWKTELYSEGGRFRTRLVSGGGGTPAFRFECHTSSGWSEDTCNFNTSAEIVNESTGGVNAEFNGKSNRTKCSQGGAEAGVLEGTADFTPPTGVEGISAGAVTPGEWRLGGSGFLEEATKWAGHVALTDEGTGVSNECEATGEGIAGPGSTTGTETKWIASKCVVTHGSGTCKSAEMEAVDLPWHTQELVDIAEVGKREIITNGGAGEPGFKRTCNTALGKTVDTCTAKELDVSLENVGGGVDTKFIPSMEALKCNQAGGGKGVVGGTQLVEAAKGGKLEAQ